MEVAVVSVGGAQHLPVERGRSELVDTLPHAQRVQLPVTSQGWQCWQDCSNAASKSAEDVCMALQVADFLNADVDTWACLLASFVLGRPIRHSTHPSDDATPQHSAVVQLLLSVPACLLPSILSYASHRPLSEKLSWITAVHAASSPIHSVLQTPANPPTHELMASVVHASLKPHSADPAVGLGIAVTNRELSAHLAAVADTPQLEWLQVRCGAPAPPPNAHKPAHPFSDLRSATLIATTAAAVTDPYAHDATAAVADALACIAAAPALHHLTLEQHRVALKPSRGGMALLATRLAALHTLRALELPCCGIGPHATRALAAAVACMPALTLLNLDHNPLDGLVTTTGRPERVLGGDGDRCNHCGDGFEGLLHLFTADPGHAAPFNADRSDAPPLHVHRRPRLRHLSLLGVSLRPRGAHAFGQLIRLLPTLEHLAFSEYGLQSHTLSTLTTLSALTALAVSSTSPRICEVVMHLRGLRSFRPYGFASTRGLAAVFRKLPDLQLVDLGGHHLPAGGMEELEPGLATLRDLRSLTLGHSYLGDGGARALVRLLAGMPQLTSLTLPHATIPFALAAPAGTGIAALRDLKHLHFSWVFLGPGGPPGPSDGAAGMRVFAQALSGGNSIRTLDLCCVGLTTAAAAAALAGALACMPALRDLVLRRWACHDMHVMAPFAARLGELPATSRLDFRFSTLAEPCLIHLLAQLWRMPALAVLHLPKERLSCVSTRALAAALPRMRALRVLGGLGVGALDVDTLEALAAGVAQVPRLDVPVPLHVSPRQWAVVAERAPALIRLLCVPQHA